MTHEKYWVTQSPVTDPGKASTAIDGLGSDLASLQNAASWLVFHYRGGNFEKDGVPKDRSSEIALRYADVMFDVLLSRGVASLTRQRPSIDKVVGCCRDSVVLFLSMARHKGIPARGRVGFASYCVSGWWLDHMVAEVWDEKEARWRMVDPQMEDSDKKEINGKEVDWLDLTEDEFLTGPKAWQAARAGSVEPDLFAVAPNIDVPILRAWPYLAHNTVHDLASLTKTEMLLWDMWGIQEQLMGGQVPDSVADTLDEISSITSKPDFEPEVLEKLVLRDELRIPETVTVPDPTGGPMQQVDVRRVIGK